MVDEVRGARVDDGALTNDGTVEDTGNVASNTRPVLTGGPITSTGTIRANQGLNVQRGGDTFSSTGKLETGDANALINGTGFGDAAVTIAGTVTNLSLAKGKRTTLTLKLKPSLKKGKKVKLVLRLELSSGKTKKLVELKVTLKAR